MKTWKLEAVLAGAALGTTAALTVGPENFYATWITAGAVFLTFMHMQVADRLAEAEDRRVSLEREVRSLSQRYEHAADKPPLADVQTAEDKLRVHVECYWKLKWFLVAKEILWLATFILLKAWPALVGVGLFLLYPVWRHYYRKRRPHAR